MKPKLALLCGVALWSATARAETLQSGHLMVGTRCQTPYFIKTGEEVGPTIVVVGGLHGDEAAGYLAARELRKWTVTRGKLVVVPDANRVAVESHQRFVGRNMNRLFPGKKNGDAMEKLAFQIWNLIKQSKPDLVLTLHESRGFHADDRKRYGQTFTYDFPQLAPRFQRVATRVNAAITPRKHRFLQFVDPFPTCPTYACWKILGVPATSIETARPLALASRVGYQLAALRGFFAEWELGCEEPAPRVAAERATAPALPSS